MLHFLKNTYDMATQKVIGIHSKFNICNCKQSKVENLLKSHKAPLDIT